MESFGAYLKREREMRGIGLREVAQTTKIGLPLLEALESERFEVLGGEVFVRGFLRNYAKYLGLDAEDVVLRYDEYRIKTAPAEETGRGETPVFAPDRKTLLAGAGALGSLVIVALFVLLASPGEKAPPPAPQAAPAAAALPLSAPEPATHPVEPALAAGEPVAAAKPDAAMKPAAKLVLVLQAEQPCYVKVWADQGEPFEREMVIGGELRFEAEQRFELLAGNAGGLSLTLNGKPLPKLGPEGRVRRRVITSEGVFPP